jgi:putative oxidoreductase
MGSTIAWYKRGIALCERIPYSLIALVARVAVFEVFWRSGSAKLDDWAGTLNLFTEEFKVPLLPPELAAQLAAGLELGGSVLVLVGLATRPAVLALIGMVAVIQIFVFPAAWPTHVQWLAFMLILLAKGPGLISMDHAIARLLQRSR